MSASPSTEQIKRYYDGHADVVQERTGVNRRHRSILRRLVRTGLRKHHHVLEVGCGIGQLTGLVAPRVAQGSVTAVDISPKAVERARQRLARHAHVTISVDDMTAFRSERRFDRVLLPDVLEHIPEELHDRLFATLVAHLAPEGKVCIHIPDPGSIRWAQRERPEILQIVDQPLEILPMAERFARVGLVLQRYDRYGLWTREPDYDWIEFGRPETTPARISLPYAVQLWQELRSRID